MTECTSTTRTKLVDWRSHGLCIPYRGSSHSVYLDDASAEPQGAAGDLHVNLHGLGRQTLIFRSIALLAAIFGAEISP